MSANVFIGGLSCVYLCMIWLRLFRCYFLQVGFPTNKQGFAFSCVHLRFLVLWLSPNTQNKKAPASGALAMTGKLFASQLVIFFH